MADQPTDEQKMAAARAALAALDPPVTESIIGDRLVDATVAIVWSQLELVPPALAAAAPGAPERAAMAYYSELMYTDDPELEARIKAVNAEHAAISQEIRKDRLEDAAKPEPAPTR